MLRSCDGSVQAAVWRPGGDFGRPRACWPGQGPSRVTELAGQGRDQKPGGGWGRRQEHF